MNIFRGTTLLNAYSFHCPRINFWNGWQRRRWGEREEWQRRNRIYAGKERAGRMNSKPRTSVTSSTYAGRHLVFKPEYFPEPINATRITNRDRNGVSRRSWATDFPRNRKTSFECNGDEGSRRKTRRVRG